MSYQNLIIWQYKGKPKAMGTATLISDTFSDSFRKIANIPNAMDINNATGADLDLCGKRVGQSRVLNSFFPRDVFGFYEVEGAKGFSRLGTGGGGKWYRYGDPTRDTVVLNDADYRFLIKCRIAKNFQVGTMPDIINALNFIFDNAIAYDNYDMSISVVIRQNISNFKRFILKNLDILPRPAAVGIKHYISTSKKAFGFRGAPHGVGFNQGRFARIL